MLFTFCIVFIYIYIFYGANCIPNEIQTKMYNFTHGYNNTIEFDIINKLMSILCIQHGLCGVVVVKLYKRWTHVQLTFQRKRSTCQKIFSETNV